MSLTNYFVKHCEKQDKNFWNAVSTFMSDKKYHNGGNITLNENGETITDVSRVSEIFNDFFLNIAMDIGFNDDVISASDAIRRRDQYPNVKRIREYYHAKNNDFDFHVVDTETVVQLIKNINKLLAAITFLENLFELPLWKSIYLFAPFWKLRSQPRVFHRLWNMLMLVLVLRKRTILLYLNFMKPF